MALAAVGYPLSVLVALALGVTLRYVWRQGVACYPVLSVPLMAAYMWLR